MVPSTCAVYRESRPHLQLPFFLGRRAHSGKPLLGLDLRLTVTDSLHDAYTYSAEACPVAALAQVDPLCAAPKPALHGRGARFLLRVIEQWR